MSQNNSFYQDRSQENSIMRIKIPFQNRNLNQEPFTPNAVSAQYQSSSIESISNGNRTGKNNKKRIKKLERKIKFDINVQSNKQKINKKKQKQQKAKKRFIDKNVQSKTGRPNNKDLQGKHLKENKSYNDIVFHFSRFMIFLKIKYQENQNQNQTIFSVPFTKNSSDQQWFNKMKKIMSEDNFPEYQAVKPEFLLHPNSPHYIFNKLASSQQVKTIYSGQQIKLILLAFLHKKRLLYQNLYIYIKQYWKDIVHLIKHPNGENAIDNDPFEEQLSGQVIQQNDLQEKNIDDEQKGSKKKNKGPKAQKNLNEYQTMRAQLSKDETIIAYEIACYLHACCMKFHLQILS